MRRHPIRLTVCAAAILTGTLCHCQRGSGPEPATAAEQTAATVPADAAAAKQPPAATEPDTPPTPSMEANDLGVESYFAKRLPDAVRHLERAIELDAENKTAHFNLGQVLMAMSRWREAEQQFVRAIELDDSIADFHEKAGSAAYRADELDRAETHLGRAIKLAPDSYRPYYRLARVSERQDRAEAAARHYTKAIMLEPTFLEAYVHLGTLYADHEFYDESAQVFEQGLRVAPKCSKNDMDLRHRLGTVRLEQRRHKAAAELFEQALACDPNQADTLFSAGWTRALMGDDARAREHLRAFVKLAQGDDSVRADYVMAAQYKLEELGEGP